MNFFFYFIKDIYFRLSALAHDIGPMIRQWTTGSAINHLRGFVTGVHVELDEVRRFIVRRESMEQYAAARASRRAGRIPVPDSGSQMEVRTEGSPATMEVDQEEVGNRDMTKYYILKLLSHEEHLKHLNTPRGKKVFNWSYYKLLSELFTYTLKGNIVIISNDHAFKQDNARITTVTI